MNVTVVGATGGIGSQVVEQLRSRGHCVTPYVRNPGKVLSSWGDDVTVVAGELSDAAAVDRAVQAPTPWSAPSAPAWTARPPGCPWWKAPGTSSPPCGATACAATSATAPPSVLDPREKPTWQPRLSTFMARRFLRRAYDELVALSEVVTSSGLNWTIVRFLAPKDGAAKEQVRQVSYGQNKLGFNLT